MESAEYSFFKVNDSKYKDLQYEDAVIDNKPNDRCVSYSLIIPAFNEEKRIKPFLMDLVKILPLSWEIIIVCDGTDGTAEIARQINTNGTVLQFKDRLGKGGAIREGFKVANANIIGYADADGAISPSDILKVFNTISKNTDVAIGSRWLRESKVEVPQPIYRILLGRLYHYFTFAILGLTQKDTQCGVKAFKQDTLTEILSAVTIKNLSFDTAVLFHCKKNGHVIKEVPISWKNKGGSKVTPTKTAMIMFLSLLGIRLAHAKRAKTLSIILESVRNLVENA